MGLHASGQVLNQHNSILLRLRGPGDLPGVHPATPLGCSCRALWILARLSFGAGTLHCGALLYLLDLKHPWPLCMRCQVAPLLPVVITKMPPDITHGPLGDSAALAENPCQERTSPYVSDSASSPPPCPHGHRAAAIIGIMTCPPEPQPVRLESGPVFQESGTRTKGLRSVWLESSPEKKAQEWATRFQHADRH